MTRDNQEFSRDVPGIPGALPVRSTISQIAGDMTLQSLDGPFGMEVIGVKLAKALTDETRLALNKALVEHQVLLFRKQRLGDEQIREIASWFGDVRVLPGAYTTGEKGVPGVRHITNLGPSGRPTGSHPDPFSREWHADGAWMQTPARATLLYALEVPELGGSTQFADMYGGLEAFDESERRRLETLEVIHDVTLARVFRYGRAVSIGRRSGARRRLRIWLRLLSSLLPGRSTVHPVIRMHPESGRPAIVLGCDAWRIRGMGWRRGMREVSELTKRSIRPERVLTHHWQPGDLLVWDNRSLLHRVTDYDFKGVARVMRQVVIVERTTRRPVA